LETLPPPQKTITLADALKHYKAKLKKPSVAEQKQVKWAWQAFTKAMGVRTLKDVTKEKVNAWASKLLERYSPKMARNRLARVRVVLRYNEKHEHDLFNCQRLLRYIAALELPEQELPDPKPISVADFQKLLNAAQAWAKEDDHFTYWPAMLLTALNCCYYAIDLIRLPVAAVDLAKGTICFDRGKTNTARVAVLWPRTVEALKPILAGREKRKLVFETYRRGGWSRSGFVKAFNKLRQRAGFHFFPIDVGEDEADRTKRKKLVAPKGLPSLEFNQIRDGAYTAAIEGGAEPMHAQILAGHRTGIKDSYVKRNPKMVADACASIEKHYFPDKK
jgi:integrase